MTEEGDDIDDRLNAAESLLQAGQYGEATDEFVWLWHNAARIEPAMEGVRVSFMADDIKELVRAYDPARQRFAKIRDETGSLANAGGSLSAKPRLDWVVLNEILGDEQAILSWFDGVKNQSKSVDLLERVAHRLIPVLQARNRLSDIGRLFSDPVTRLIATHQNMQPPRQLGEKLDGASFGVLLERVKRTSAQRFQRFATLLVRSLRAAGRVQEAAVVKYEALRLDPSHAMREAMQQAGSHLH